MFIYFNVYTYHTELLYRDVKKINDVKVRSVKTYE
jgi:hypothetical protein